MKECNCGPDQVCPKCKDEKLICGMGPKYDQGKLQYSLIPPSALKALAQILTFGAEKYAPNSWKNVNNGDKRYLDALYRHLEAFRSGDKNDEESSYPHLWHAITNLAFLIELERSKHEEE